MPKPPIIEEIEALVEACNRRLREIHGTRASLAVEEEAIYTQRQNAQNVLDSYQRPAQPAVAAPVIVPGSLADAAIDAIADEQREIVDMLDVTLPRDDYE